MLTEIAVDHFEGYANLAEALGISRQAVYQWGDTVPEGMAYKLQVITAGHLRVDPSDYPSKTRTAPRPSQAV
jgi:hypothetical protein